MWQIIDKSPQEGREETLWIVHEMEQNLRSFGHDEGAQRVTGMSGMKMEQVLEYNIQWNTKDE